MNVEISVALNFVISYLYNRLPRRRVDLFGEELEAGLEKKFQGHWYPDKPNKGSGYRCVKANGDEVDPVLMEATVKAGLDITEVKNYLPDDLTLWIDPSEVSYKIGEKGPVKVLYSDKKDDDGTDTMDKEVQAANRTFNPEAQTFTPEAQTTFSPDVLAFTPELTNFCTDSSQSFQTIDSISSSLSNLSLSPSSPLPPGTWSTATSPSSNLFSSALPSSTATPPAFLGPRPNNSGRQHFTAATFAQTKFGSTKLKTQVKRPNRLSPTEFGNFFRQQQRSYSGPQRPRSLSPRDPRVEFLWDQQQRMLIQQHNQQQHHHHHQQQQQQQQHRQHQQMSPTMPYGGMQYHNNQQHLHRQQQQQHQQQQHHHQQQQQLSPTGMYPDFLRQHSSGISSSHSSPHMSPQGNSPAFQDLIQQSAPNQRSTLASPTAAISRPNSLGVHMGRGPSGFPMGLASSMAGGNGEGFGQGSRPLSQASGGALSPDQPHAPFVDGLGVAPVNYSNSVQHLLMAN